MIAIVGGGITGLAAAYELTVRRVPFQLFEASPRLGGIIRTEQVDGFTIEAGPDSILAQKPAAIGLCEALGLGPRLITTTPPRTAFVLNGGRLRALPSPSVLGIPTTWNGLIRYDLLSAKARARLALERVIRRRALDEDESVGAFFRRRFGPETVNAIAEPLLGGIHAGDIEALSIRSLFPRFVDAESKHGSVLRAFRGGSPGSDGAFRSLLGGMEELVATLQGRLPRESVRSNSIVEAISPAHQSWNVTSAGVTTTARAVILACPAHVAAHLLEPIDARAAQLCAEVPYVSTVEHRARLAARGSPSPAERIRIRRGASIEQSSPHRVHVGVVEMEPTRAGGNGSAARLRRRIARSVAVDMPDDDAGGAGVPRAAIRFLASTGPPQLSRVYRWRQAGAQHNVGQIARVAEIEQRLTESRGLFVAGSGFRSVGIPDCVADGRAAAAAACGTIQ